MSKIKIKKPKYELGQEVQVCVPCFGVYKGTVIGVEYNEHADRLEYVCRRETGESCWGLLEGSLYSPEIDLSKISLLLQQIDYYKKERMRAEDIIDERILALAEAKEQAKTYSLYLKELNKRYKATLKALRKEHK